MYRQLGAEGVVIGILKPDGTLNMEQMEGLMREAEGMSVTLHRAFDVCTDPFAALEDAVKLGIDTILTSGQKNSCSEGAELLRKLEEQSAGRIMHSGGRRRQLRSHRSAGPGDGYQSLAYVRKGDAGQQNAVSERRRQYGASVAQRVRHLPYICGKNPCGGRSSETNLRKQGYSSAG